MRSRHRSPRSAVRAVQPAPLPSRSPSDTVCGRTLRHYQPCRGGHAFKEAVGGRGGRPALVGSRQAGRPSASPRCAGHPDHGRWTGSHDAFVLRAAPSPSERLIGGAGQEQRAAPVVSHPPCGCRHAPSYDRRPSAARSTASCFRVRLGRPLAFGVFQAVARRASRPRRIRGAPWPPRQADHQPHDEATDPDDDYPAHSLLHLGELRQPPACVGVSRELRSVLPTGCTGADGGSAER